MKTKTTEKPAKKLNLGSGEDYRPPEKGWINLDNNRMYHPDILHDIAKVPFPFKKDTFDEIFCSHIFEHFSDLVTLLEELYRISKSKAIITIKVPHFSHFTAYGDITHKKYFSTMCFSHTDGYYSHKFKIMNYFNHRSFSVK